jgi:predicted nucleic acid-binding protein
VTQVVIDPGVLVSAFISPKKAAHYLLALAQTYDADAVVSGDPHLLEAASSTVQVLTPRELVDRLGFTSAG